MHDGSSEIAVPSGVRGRRDGQISGRANRRGREGAASFRRRAVLPALLSGCVLTGHSAPVIADAAHYENRSRYSAPKALQAVTIDGIADDAAWRAGEWYSIDHVWLGPAYTDEDFSGRFKVAWTKDKLYVLVEVVDDILFDSHRDPLVQYWDDDCVEIFIDEDYSGGDHQYNHNAFAYHMSLDNRAIDMGTDEQPHEYSHHVESRWRQTGNTVVWELAIDIYADDYVDGAHDNRPVTLYAGKVMGLMLAYCDNDGSELRENFVGSESVPYGPKDRGWIDAGLFGELKLMDTE